MYKRQSILLSANKNNQNEENIQTMEMKTKKRHKRKLINTREELEMMKNGLINMFNIPITDHEEIINVQDYRRSTKILEMTYYGTTSNHVKNSISKWNIPKLERYTKLSMKQQIIKVALKYLFYKRNGKVVDVIMNTNRQIVLELMYSKAPIIRGIGWQGHRLSLIHI